MLFFLKTHNDLNGLLVLSDFGMALGEIASIFPERPEQCERSVGRYK
jgi:hypothetical protein